MTIPKTSADFISEYYSILFTKFQQKDISGVLTFMWHNDPFKAKWAILAKAYSVIRDHEGKENAPLGKFLLINSDFIGIVAPGSYMAVLGFEIYTNIDGQLMLRRESMTNNFSSHLLTTDKSVNDVIKNSYQNGLVTGCPSQPAVIGNGPVLTMAISAQPSSFHGTTNGDHKGQLGDANTGSKQQTASGNGGIQTQLKMSSMFNPENLTPLLSHYINTYGSSSKTDPAVSTLGNSVFRLEGEYPYLPEFDPSLPSQVYNPFIGNHFNTFNMSDWVDEDAFER